jgi:hypothetical protein
MQGPRNVVLSGAADSTTKITVDNFILVGLKPASASFNASYYHAYGTSDSTIMYNGNSDNILLQNSPVLLQPFGSGGTSTLTPLQVDGQMQVGSPTEVDVRALDCGGIGNNSDIYIVFQ